MIFTGVRRGPGWRPVRDTGPGDFRSVVRFLALCARRNEFLHLGSGSVIGGIDGRRIIVATASHIFENIDQLLGLRAPPLPAFDSPEDRENKRFNREMGRLISCGVTLRNGRETLCPIIDAQVSKHRRRRDTAVVIALLPEEMRIVGLPIDLERPPPPNETLLVAGFGKRPASGSAIRRGSAESVALPERVPIVREGCFIDFGSRTAGLDYPLFRHSIPIESGMSGGPVIVLRQVTPCRAVRTMVAINNTDIRSIEGDYPEGEGFATPVIVLYSHTVALSPDEEIPFIEAVRRGMVCSFGPRALR